jgi:hypothetical protein
MVSAAQVREVILKFASGQLDAESFRKQFSLLSHNIHKCQDEDAVRLCNAVEAQISEVLIHQSSIDEFKQALARELYARPAVGPMVVVLNMTVADQPLTASVPLSTSGGMASPLGWPDTSNPALIPAHARGAY